MKFHALPLTLWVCGFAFTCAAGELRLDGIPFRPNVPVTWGDNGILPQNVTVYTATLESFSPGAVSNAMAIGLFKASDRAKTKDASVLRYQDHRDKFAVTRYLEVCPSRGWMNYYDQSASGVQTSIHGVPSDTNAIRLAMALLHTLGGNTNEVAPRRGPPGESTVTSYNHKTGHEVGKAVYMRSVTINRQVDGIEMLGNSLAVDYCNDGKPGAFRLTWHTLRAECRYKVQSPAEILKCINAGKSVIPNPGIIPPQLPREHAKSFAITQTRLFYMTVPDENKKDRFYPFAQFVVIADGGSTNSSTFLLECSIIADTN